MNPYETLGVGREATPEEIKRAYQAKRSKAHPDKGGTPEAFYPIQKAYEVLSDEKRREQYDKHGDTSQGPDEHQVILSTIASLVINALDNDPYEQNDAIDTARRMTRSKIEQIEQVRARAEAQAKKFRKQAERITRKDAKGVNFLRDAILAHVRVFENQAESAGRELEIGKRVYAELGEYKCRMSRERATANGPLAAKLFFGSPTTTR